MVAHLLGTSQMEPHVGIMFHWCFPTPDSFQGSLNTAFPEHGQVLAILEVAVMLLHAPITIQAVAVLVRMLSSIMVALLLGKSM
jgi:hypothetical protein